MTERIGCMNPRCRRTAPAEKYDPGESIICRPCWRQLPTALVARHTALARREKKLIRLIDNRLASDAITWARIQSIDATLDELKAMNWARIEASFTAPDKPTGIDNFLSEIGIGERNERH